ncbi:MAG: hypothetical protein AAB512_04630 [Patescibacteria group bacterium]
MKKKILYIFLVGVIATIVSLFRYTPQYIIMCDPVSCPPVRASRGYPLPIPVSEYKYVDGSLDHSNRLPVIVGQAIAFSVNITFYSIIFSVIYFVCSKVSKKVKKK